MTQRDKIGAIVLTLLMAALCVALWFSTRSSSSNQRRIENSTFVDQISRTQQQLREKK